MPRLQTCREMLSQERITWPRIYAAVAAIPYMPQTRRPSIPGASLNIGTSIARESIPTGVRNLGKGNKMKQQCGQINAKGHRCRHVAAPNMDFCTQHHRLVNVGKPQYCEICGTTISKREACNYWRGPIGQTGREPCVQCGMPREQHAGKSTIGVATL